MLWCPVLLVLLGIGLLIIWKFCRTSAESDKVMEDALEDMKRNPDGGR